MEISTIGFTHKSAEQFFETLRHAGVQRLIDVRLNNTSQLAAFTKRDDLKYFLRVLLSADYIHEKRLAPTADALDAYRKGRMSWDDYEELYLRLLQQRRVETVLPHSMFEVPVVLLCSEAEPEHCHRRLAAEYLAQRWPGISVRHL